MLNDKVLSYFYHNKKVIKAQGGIPSHMDDVATLDNEYDANDEDGNNWVIIDQNLIDFLEYVLQDNEDEDNEDEEEHYVKTQPWNMFEKR